MDIILYKRFVKNHHFVDAMKRYNLILFLKTTIRTYSRIKNFNRRKEADLSFTDYVHKLS